MGRVALALLAGCSYTPVELVSPDVAECAGVGHDEDGDEIDDACDNCPTVSSANVGDGDGDGIGDACDPDPIDGGDRRRDFITFAEAGASTRWEVLDAGWTWVTDELRFADPGPEFRVIRDSLPAFATPIVIDIGIVVTTAPTQKAHFGLLANVNGPVNGGVACAIVRETDGDSVVFINVPGGSASALPLPAPIGDGSSYRLTYAYDPARQRASCTVADGPDVAVTVTTPPPVGPLGFEAMGITARVVSASIYGRD
jgi:hypothetical protein